jgi:hypothetical protein
MPCLYMLLLLAKAQHINIVIIIHIINSYYYYYYYTLPSCFHIYFRQFFFIIIPYKQVQGFSYIGTHYFINITISLILPLLSLSYVRYYTSTHTHIINSTSHHIIIIITFALHIIIIIIITLNHIITNVHYITVKVANTLHIRP